MAMNNFRGYWLKVEGVVFNSPSPKRETFKVAPELVQVGKSYVLASGKLHTKPLPHDRSKVWCDFPPMTPEQAKVYWDALHGDQAGQGMYLNVEAYDIINDTYINDTFYHNDLETKPIKYGGRDMVVFEPFELIGH
jgi:hypothetical protein